jgi:hypothetical protein
MSSQTKITGFYRPTKPTNSSVAAAKRRKAIIEDPICEVESKCDIKPVVASLKQETTAKVVTEPGVLLKSDLLKTEPGPTGNSKNIFTDGIELEKSVQKKTSVRKSKKTIKSTESSLKVYFPKTLMAENPCVKTEIIKEETTSFADNHGCIPVSTPKGTTGLTTSCRKRKMQCVDEQSEVTSKTPEKPTEKSDAGIELSTKVRKKLEMGTEKVAVIEEVKTKADILNSPSKPVTFICMGTLSPRKPGLNSPIRMRSSPLINKLQSSSEKLLQNLTEKRFKSPVVKSLASLLDSVAPTKELPKKVI